jgi:aromatic ring-opening dioxygenase LigB subunit
MSNFKIIILIVSSLFLLAAIVMIAAIFIRRKNKKKSVVEVTEPNIFEKITLQFSDKISKELNAAEKKIRSVVGNDDTDKTEREHGMFL